VHAIALDCERPMISIEFVPLLSAIGARYRIRL